MFLKYLNINYNLISQTMWTTMNKFSVADSDSNTLKSSQNLKQLQNVLLFIPKSILKY